MEFPEPPFTIIIPNGEIEINYDNFPEIEHITYGFQLRKKGGHQYFNIYGFSIYAIEKNGQRQEYLPDIRYVSTFVKSLPEPPFKLYMYGDKTLFMDKDGFIE